MNECCNLCPHQKTDERIKSLYNRYTKQTFDPELCPLDDPKFDCFIRFLPIDWEDFKTFLKDNGITVPNE